MAGLKQHSPAFLLLDFDVKGAKSFLFDISRSFYHPQPYVIVSATFSNGMDRAAMLRQGADACVEKPIIAEEVLAVIEAALRHSRRSTWSHQGKLLSRIEYKELIIDPLRRTVTMHGRSIILTAKEFDVLYTLGSHEGEVLTKEEIYAAVWKDKYDHRSTNVSDQISSIRRKLGLNSRDVNYIQTVIGVGYRFGTSI